MKLSRIFTAGLMFLASAGAQAVPAYPGIITSSQPDGTGISIRLYGDENFSWARTADGYTLLRDKAGYWAVVRRDASGLLVPTDLRPDGSPIAERASRMGISPMLPMTKTTSETYRKAPARVAAEDLQVDATFPTTGKRKLLLLLVNFSDTYPTFSQADFNNFMNQKDFKGIGSFRDFYLENSYGKFDVETTVTPWITVPYRKAQISDNDIATIIGYALSNLPAGINIADFDNNGDGILDGLAIIHQGPGQEATGNTQDIWSHSSAIYGMTINGIEVRRYTIQPEVFGNTGQMSDIGVMTHEFGHNLGAPDFYDTDYDNSGGDFCGTGIWDLMGSGAWNGFGERSSGDRPAPVNMWQKIMFGWVEPVTLTESTEITAMPNSTENPVAYRFDTTSDGDYFILENRQQNGNFNAPLPGHGLLVMHANDKIISSRIMTNTVNALAPQGCYVVCAGAASDPGTTPNSYGGLSTANTLFPQGNHTFNDASLPSTRAIDKRWAYKGLTNIADNGDGTIRFTFTAADAPAAPTNLRADVVASDVNLNWDAVKDATPDGYNIYRNEELIDFVTDTQYTDRNPEVTGRIEYTVDAKYPDGRISPPVKVAIRMPQPKVETLSAITHDDGVHLNWALNPNLTRMQEFASTSIDIQIRDIRGEKIEYGIRFTADDLKTYAGMKIRRIGFLPYQSLQEASYVLNVYEADADGSNPTVVSTRNIKEMGNSIWNTILLSKSVEILPGKEYWITVTVEPKVKVAQLITEPSDVLDGYGNLLRINDGEWTTDTEARGNFYVHAILQDATCDEQAEIELDGSEMNPDLDLYFPIGFRIYRDGQYIGESASRCFIDSPRPSGTHSYRVTTLYKGNCETAPCEALEVNTDNVGITTIAAPESETPLYYLNGTRAPGQGAKGILLRKGEKVIK